MQKASIKEWFQKKGGKYKDGSMIVQGPKGVFIVNLDWSNAKNIIWRNKSFLDVPYLLDNGKRYVPGADGKGAASFNLVIHLYKIGDYRAAIRTTSYDGLCFETSKKVVQFYKMLNGRPMNVWYKDSRRKRVMPAERLKLSKKEFLQMQKTMQHNAILSRASAAGSPTAMALSGEDNEDVLTEGYSINTYDSANCTITETTTYYDCSPTGDGGSQGDGEYAGPVVVATCPYVEHVVVCSGDPIGGDNESGEPNTGTGGGGGPGGGSGNGPNDNNDCSDEAPPPPPQPPINPDGTTAPPSEPPTPCELFPPENPPEPDPCATQQAQNAENITKRTAFIGGLNAVKDAAVDGNEHSVSFNMESDGTLTVTPVILGAPTSGQTAIGNKTVAGIHNHQNAMPPSAGDVYSLIESNSNHSNYTIKFVVIPDGSIYALVITNRVTAQSFISKYPKSELPGFSPDFTDYPVDGNNLFDEYTSSCNSFRGIEELPNVEANEGALAYILDNYNSGIALLKMNPDGTFSKINTIKTGGKQTNSTFFKTKCQN